MDFSGKVVIVTGGAEGIGKSICKEFLDVGSKVCIFDYNKEMGEMCLQELSNLYENKVHFVQCDVANLETLKDAFKEAATFFGHIDVLVNNAGVMDSVNWMRMINVNFVGVINGMNLALEFMGKNHGGNGGHIINIASNAGFAPFPFCPIYSGCKHGVVGLTKSYAHEYHFDKTGVSVNAVCPGPVDTRLYHAFPSNSIDKEAAEIHNKTRLDRVCNPAEVAKAVIKVLNDQKNGAFLRINSSGMTYIDVSR